MLKRILLIAVPLMAAEAPAPLSIEDRLKVSISQSRVVIAYTRKVEAELAAARAERELADLTKAHQALVGDMRKKSNAGDKCALDLEGNWQCDTSPR